MAEITMERLMAEAPALADQLRAEGASKAPSFTDFMAVAAPFIGEAGKKALEDFYGKCTAAGMTMEQMAAMAPMAAPQVKEADRDLKAEILAELKRATPASFTSAPAPAPAGKTARDYLMEAAEKLGKE